MNRILGIALAAALLGTAVTGRADVTVSATDNATIQPSGPRTGANGQKFFNIEGTANGTFASFGVADFNVASLGPISALNGGLSVRLVEADASFTHAGAINFYLASDTTTNTDAGTSPLVFQTAVTPTGVDNQLGTLYSLGSGNFTSTGSANSGQIDTFSLSLNAAAVTFLNTQVNQSGGKLRLVITPGTTDVSATFAGFTYLPPPPNPGPQITIGTVPEPGVLVQSGLAAPMAAGVLAFRRRRAA